MPRQATPRAGDGAARAWLYPISWLIADEDHRRRRAEEEQAGEVDPDRDVDLVLRGQGQGEMLGGDGEDDGNMAIWP